MKRRELALSLAGAAGLCALGARAAPAAPAGLVEGRDYVAVAAPLHLASGKIEVSDFFWYGCPHCHAFERQLEPWVARLPADVHFLRVAFGFGDALRELHQQIYYTWESLGLVERMHALTFDRFHKDRKPIDSEEDLLRFASESGLDAAQVKAAWNGFGVHTRLAQAREFCDGHGLEFVPQLGIQGRYLTSPSLVGTGPGALAVADRLIDLVRRGR